MKFRIGLLLIILYSFFTSPLIAGNDKCHKSTEGTDFWFSFMENRNLTTCYVEITVTAKEASQFTIKIGTSETLYGTYSVAANSSEKVKITSWSSVEATGSETIQNTGIHLESDNPVNVYALNYDANSADVAVIYPTESLNKEYFAMCYTPDVAENGRNSEFLIVASDDKTTIEIIPSKVTDQKKAAGDTFSITLNKGQVYQVQSENTANASGQGDLTGSHIISDKPVAFFSGCLSTRIPSGTCCYDHLYEQIPPLQSWGREYYTIPLEGRQKDRFRIMAAKNNTTVKITGGTTITLNSGEYVEKEFSSAVYISSNQPILVAQYSQSRDVDGYGDPFMIILSPTVQSRNDVTFEAYTSSYINYYYLNIVALTSEIPGITLDGSSLNSQFQAYSDNGGEYSYAQIKITSGTHHLASQGEDGFLAYAYGFGDHESYGYGAGFNLDLILDLGKSIEYSGETITLSNDTLTICYGDSATLDAGIYFDSFFWNTGDSTQKLIIAKEGEYSVKTTTEDGCILFDTIFVNVSHPETGLGADLDSCPPYSVVLDAGAYFPGYLWNTGDTTRTITANQTGEYQITVTDRYGCKDRDTLQLTVYPAPEVKISGDSLVCGTKTASLNAILSGADSTLWNYSGSILWSADNPGIIFSDPGKVSTRVIVPDWGEYSISFSVITINGCESDGQFNIRFFDTPTSTFIFADDTGDKCKGYYREIAYSGNASEDASFYWDFGGSRVLDTLGWQNYYVSLGTYNTNPYVTLSVEENGCRSDTTQMLIGANANFKIETEASRGCDSATIYFKGKLEVPDSLLFEWDFGDGSAINNLQNPQHKYTQAGFYDVGLSITNLLSGCRIAYTLDDFVKIFATPVANFSADPNLCYPDSFKVIYLNNIDSSICYWSFNGAHQWGAGNDTINVIADSPFADITLLVNEYGCISPSVTKTVKRKPNFDFTTETNEGCQPLELEILAVPLDESLEFTWLTDSLPYPSGLSANYLFPGSGYFDVSLSAYSNETQCSDTLTKSNWIWVHPKPLASFEVDYPVATIANPKISFNNLSELGTSYFWDFGDGNTSEEKNPSNTYSSLGDYTATLVTESEYSCLDTATLLIKILPFSVFTPNAFRPDSDIPENREFMPVGLGTDPDRFNLMIFNRWGEKVFETKTPDNKWDGKTKNGNKAPTGNYVWISDYFDIQGFEHHQKGQVLLIR